MVANLAACAPELRLQPPPPLLVWNAPRMPVFRPPLPDVPPSYLVLLPNADGTTGKVIMNSGQGKQTLDKPKQGADVQGGGEAFAVTDTQLKRDFGAAMAAKPTLPERYRVNFAPKSVQLTAESVRVMDAIVKRSQNFSALEIALVGHTDTKGDADDNYQLGLERARLFANMLLQRGVQAINIEIGSDGENFPLVPTGDNVAEARNRRVEVVLR